MLKERPNVRHFRQERVEAARCGERRFRFGV
jgi:hypothetical protein